MSHSSIPFSCMSGFGCWHRLHTKLFFPSKRFSIFREPLWFSNRGRKWHRPNICLHVQSSWASTWNLQRPTSLCAIQRKYKSHKILVSEKQYSKDIFFSRNTHIHSRRFSAKISKRSFLSQKPSHRTVPVGSWKSFNCPKSLPISSRNNCACEAWYT